MATMRGIIIVSLLFLSMALNAQLRLDVRKNLNYRQKTTPVVMDNYLFSTYYGAGKKSYNLKGFEINSTGKEIQDIRLNPAGYSYALLSGVGKSSKVEIFDLNEAGRKIKEFDEVADITAIAYSYDSRHIYMATGTPAISVYDTKDYRLVKSMSLPLAATELSVSPNGFFIAAALGKSVVVIDVNNGGVRKEILFPVNVRSISFSNDALMFGVLTDEGLLNIYDTRTFDLSCSLTNLGDAKSFSFHPENKYVAIAKDGNMLLFVNMADTDERQHLMDADGEISKVHFVRDGKNNIYVTYNSHNSIKYKQILGFSPNYTRLLRDELQQRMAEWSKIQEGESLDDYKLRVNEETRQRQARLFEQEIATRMADDYVMSSAVSLGMYNTKNRSLTIEFDNMPPISLDVPEDDVMDFMDAGNLEFRDAVYGLSKNDKFELIYANVYNKKSGKSYQFNNLERRNLEFLDAGDDFVPIELVQQSSMEEVKLNALKKGIVDDAKKKKLISDHTLINVNTRVVSDVDASGKKITKYNVGFSYSVDMEFSMQEDFAAGKYKVEESHAALSMLKIVKEAFETDFAQYIKADKKLIINIKGAADALPIRGAVYYDGCYGAFENEPYYLDGNLSSTTVTQKSGIRNNEQLAFIRAASVKDYIKNNIHGLDKMDVMYNCHVEVSGETGGAYRRISVEFSFVDAF